MIIRDTLYLVSEYHIKIYMYNFLEEFYTPVPISKYNVQYSVCKNLCEHNHVFTLNVSHSGELEEAKKLYQKCGSNHHLYFV